MIVEDDENSLDIIQRRILKLGYTVSDTATSGEEAVEKARQNPPDLVLMDIMLKGEMDGIDTAYELYHSLKVPVVYLTAYMDKNLLERAKTTFPFGYLIKPVNKTQLESTLELALHRYQDQRKHFIEKKSEEIQNTDDAVIVTNSQGKIKSANPSALELLEVQEEGRIRGKPISEILLNTMVSHNNHCTLFLNQTQKGKILSGNISPMTDHENNILGSVFIFRDSGMTPSGEKTAQAHEEVLNKVKNSHGLLSICSGCKKIKDPGGKWELLETYLKVYSDIKISHGFCPHCLEELYPQLYGQEQIQPE
jgi:CheY-like chemotaxis protein